MPIKRLPLTSSARGALVEEFYRCVGTGDVTALERLLWPGAAMRPSDEDAYPSLVGSKQIVIRVRQLRDAGVRTSLVALAARGPLVVACHRESPHAARRGELAVLGFEVAGGRLLGVTHLGGSTRWAREAPGVAADLTAPVR